MKLKDKLAELNKNLADRDKWKIVSDVPEDEMETKCVSTGSHKLDKAIRSYNGGIPLGRLTLLVGNEGSGKSSIACLAAASLQKETGKYVIYLDSEGTLDNSYFNRLGLDRNLTVHYNDKNLDNMLDTAEELSKADDVGMIIIDSVLMFVSTTMEEKSSEDFSMAVDAKKYNTRMPIIYGNCVRRGIALVVINFYRENPGANMGDPRYLPRGAWQSQMSSLTLDFRKRDLIFDDNKKLIGNKVDVRVKKNKLASSNRKDVHTLSFYYDRGFDIVEEGVESFIDEGIIEVRGAWYKMPSSDGEELKFQGKQSVIDYFRNSEKEFDRLKKLMNENQ